jgi:hypothetical protein
MINVTHYTHAAEISSQEVKISIKFREVRYFWLVL